MDCSLLVVIVVGEMVTALPVQLQNQEYACRNGTVRIVCFHLKLLLGAFCVFLQIRPPDRASTIASTVEHHLIHSSIVSRRHVLVRGEAQKTGAAVEPLIILSSFVLVAQFIARMPVVEWRPNIWLVMPLVASYDQSRERSGIGSVCDACWQVLETVMGRRGFVRATCFLSSQRHPKTPAPLLLILDVLRIGSRI